VSVYPVFLDLGGRRCIVVGAGPVGRRKAEGLFEAGAIVTVVDPSAAARDAMAATASTVRHGVELVGRAFEDEDVEGAILVFACTGEPAVDAAVLAAAAERGILACDAGGTTRAAPGPDPDANDRPATKFSSGAVFRRGDLCVAVSTGGAAPAVAAEIRDRIAGALQAETQDVNADDLRARRDDAFRRMQARHRR